MKQVRKAVIPVAGYGTRFLPVTKVVPKELLPVGKRPVIQYVVQEAVAAGIEEIIFVCQPSRQEVVHYFKADPPLESFLESRGKKEELEEVRRISRLATFSVVTQNEPLGLGHAILCAREAVGNEPFLVLLPDMLVGGGERASRELIRGCGENWGLTLMKVSRERVSQYGIIEGDEVRTGLFRLRRAVEKPNQNEAPSDLAILGRYLFPPRIFPLIEKSRPGALGEIQLTDAINLLCQESHGIGVVTGEEVFDVGNPEGLLRANQAR